MLAYPVRLVPHGENEIMLIFPDVPEACVVADGEEEAFAVAGAELERVLADYVLDGRPIPSPSDICGAPTIGTDRYSLIGFEP